MSWSEMLVGNPERFGALQRLGLCLYGIAVGLVCVAFVAPGHASIRYALFVAAHTLVYLGFVIGAIADRVAGRRFSWGRFLFALFGGFFMMILGPIAMSAASATMR